MKMKFLMIAVVSASFTSAAFSQQTTGVQQPTDRASLEQQLRQRVAQAMKSRLGLSDAQMTQLQAVNSRYAPQIAKLAVQERQTRQELRAQITSPAPDQTRVSQLLDSILSLQRQRLTIVESEQKDLSAFLTPVQRAKYVGLQAQIRNRTEQLRRQNGRAFRGRAGVQPPR